MNGQLIIVRAGELEPQVCGPLKPEPLEKNNIRSLSGSFKKMYAVPIPAPGR